MIETGASAHRIHDSFGSVLDGVVTAVSAVAPDAAVYLYGSVATGQAVVGRSDVDLLTIDLPHDEAGHISSAHSEQFADLCRGVEIGAATSPDFVGNHDEAYGNRVFLRHYCVHLSGPEHHRPNHDFAADGRAARGFNGDIARHRDRWRKALDHDVDSVELAGRVARKTLLAVAGLVSVHDRTWTTDRSRAAGRWASVEPELGEQLTKLVRWTEADSGVSASGLRTMLRTTVDPLVDRFADDIGLWA